MTNRTARLADYNDYLASEFAQHATGSADALSDEKAERATYLADFAHTIVLELAYPELDFALRWCWQQFGPARGRCEQAQSEYPACQQPDPHEHDGRWSTRWLVKTNYNFGYNEWYFQTAADRDEFLRFVPQINWGERYP
jgi:hypothetical protein